MPPEYEDYLEDPSSVSEKIARDLPERIVAWRKRGDFVLWWNEDYWCARMALFIPISFGVNVSASGA